MDRLFHIADRKRIIALLAFAIVAISSFAEPSGRGADLDVASSLHDDLYNLIFGVILLALGGGTYFLRNTHKLFEILTYIFLILGGIVVCASGWMLIVKFLLFPIFYVISYLLKAILYIAVVLLPFAFFYFVGRNISNQFLRYAFYVIMAGLIILGEYYIFEEFDAGKWFPEWNFMEAFYNNLYPIEE